MSKARAGRSTPPTRPKPSRSSPSGSSTPQVAAQTYAVATDPPDNIAKDAKFDMEGFKNVLKLRAEIEGQWGGNAPPPDKYLDLSYYDRALASIR